MIGERRWTLSPSRIVSAYAAGLALALFGTLLIATAVQAPAGTGVAVLALALALVVGFGSRHAILTPGGRARRPAGRLHCTSRKQGRSPIRPATRSARVLPDWPDARLTRANGQ